MNHKVKTVGFFAWRGLYYGGFCGALAGSLMIPIAGTLLGAGYGAFTGLCLGVMIGMITDVVSYLAARYHRQMYSFHRIIVALTGIFAAGMTPFLIYRIGENLLHLPVPVADEPSLITSHFVYLILVMAAFWGGLAAAYTAQLFQEYLHDRASYYSDYLSETEEAEGTVEFWMTHLFKWWQLHLMIGIGAVWWFYMKSSANENFSRLMEELIRLFFATSAASVIVFMVLGSVFGLIVVFLNQVIFEEYFPGLSQLVYKNILMILSGAFALSLQVILLIGRVSIPFAIPIAAALAMTARAYANWYWTEDRKHKHKPLRSMDQMSDNPFIEP